MRLSYFLLAPILALSASAQLTNTDYGIEGCVNAATVTAPLLQLNSGATIAAPIVIGQPAPTTQSTCAAACANAGKAFAYFFAQPISVRVAVAAIPPLTAATEITVSTQCTCATTEPLLSQLIGASAAVDAAANAGICAGVGAQAIRVSTDFNLRACVAADAFTSTGAGNSAAAGSVGDCLRQCGASVYAIVNTAAKTCTCASNAMLNNNAVLGACGTAGNTNAIYLNTAAAQPSGGLRKRMFERQKTIGLCPTGLQACLVGDDYAVGAEAFECLDTRAELESCGGCTNGYADLTAGTGSIGTDCSTLPGVALGGSTCTLGKCEIYACKKGHNLVNGRCLRA